MTRILTAISPFSTVDREAHARRVLDVVRSKLHPPRRSASPYGPSPAPDETPLDERLLDEARRSSPPVPEREESP